MSGLSRRPLTVEQRIARTKAAIEAWSDPLTACKQIGLPDTWGAEELSEYRFFRSKGFSKPEAVNLVEKGAL